MQEVKHLFVRDRTFYKTICMIALPVVLQQLITTGVNLMDTIMLTSCGETQLSGASLANQFISIFQFMCLGLGFGASVLTAQYWGAKEPAAIRGVTALMLRICLGLCAVFFTVSLCLPRQIMTIYSPDAEIIREGARYLRISAFTFLPYGISLSLTAVLRSVHQTRLPLAASIVTFFTNVFFNWVLIFGHLGAPALWIRGAAYGTLIARVVEAGIVGGYFLLADRRIQFRIRHLFLPCGEYLKQYAHYCLPVIVSDTLYGLGNNMTSVIMGHISRSFVSANAVVSQLTRMTSVMTSGVSNASSIITGNTLGAGEKKKAYAQGVTFLVLSVLFGLVSSAIIFAISPAMVKYSNLLPETAEIARQQLYAVNITIVFSAVQSTLTKGVLRGGGDTRFLMVADVIFLWAVSIPMGYLTGIVWKNQAFIVYLAFKLDWIIKSILCTVRLLRGKWTESFQCRAEK